MEDVTEEKIYVENSQVSFLGKHICNPFYFHERFKYAFLGLSLGPLGLSLGPLGQIIFHKSHIHFIFDHCEHN